MILESIERSEILALGGKTMSAVEFQARIVGGKIEIPSSLLGQFEGAVNVILFTADDQEATWPEANRRRWQLITKAARFGLTAEEAAELSSLQWRADKNLKKLGDRPMDELESLYVKLTQEG